MWVITNLIITFLQELNSHVLYTASLQLVTGETLPILGDA